MFTEHVGGAFRLGDPQAYTRGGQSGLGQLQWTIDSFFHALGKCLLKFVGGSFVFVQAADALFPLVQLNVAENSVLHDLIALILVLQGRSLPLCARRCRGLAQGGVEEGGLRVDVEDGGGRAFEAEGESPGFAESRAEHELRDVVVADFAVGGGGMLGVGGGDACDSGMGQGQFHGPPERERFCLGGDSETNSKYEYQAAHAQTKTYALDHRITFGKRGGMREWFERQHVGSG